MVYLIPLTASLPNTNNTVDYFSSDYHTSNCFYLLPHTCEQVTSTSSYLLKHLFTSKPYQYHLTTCNVTFITIP